MIEKYAGIKNDLKQSWFFQGKEKVIKELVPDTNFFSRKIYYKIYLGDQETKTIKSSL